MKHTKKLFAIALTLIMALALTTSAFAATINVNGALEGQTYNAYKIFDVTATGTYGGADTGYAYKISSSDEWFAEVVAYMEATADAETGVYTGKGLTLTPTTTTGVYNVSADEVTFSAADFAEDLATKTTGKTVDGTATGAAEGATTINVIEAGYYFIDSNLGALCSLQTSDAVVEMVEKNAVPSLDKKISATEGSYADADISVSIGDTVYYQITVTDAIGTDAAITVHDVMEDGLTLDADSFAVMVDDAAVDASNYVVTTAGLNDGCTFEIVFNAEYVESLEEEAEIVITYEAVLNGDAEIYGDTDEEDETVDGLNKNKTWLTYSEQESAHDDVDVVTYKFDLVKTLNDANGKAVLDGAEFKLYDAAKGGNEIAVVKVEDGLYRVAMDNETGVVIEAGYVTIKGLKGNTTYYLEETVAPAGYNKLTEREEVAIEEVNLDATVTDAAWVSGGIRVINETGALLPSTGGIGTTIFYVVGALLMAGAGVLLVTKKRMADEE